jgi:hypothetical protein
MTTASEWRKMCAELLGIFEKYDDESNLGGIVWDMKMDGNDLLNRARAALAQPEPTGLPPGYINPEHTGADRHLLQVFYRACQSEGGTADEIHLRGIRAVAAAVLAAAADQVVPHEEVPHEEVPPHEMERLRQRQRTRDDLLAIAAELEGGND